MGTLDLWEQTALKEQAGGYAMRIEPADLLLIVDVIRAADALTVYWPEKIAHDPYWTQLWNDAQTEYRQARAKIEGE